MDPQAFINRLQITEHTAGSIDWGSPCKNLGGREPPPVLEHMYNLVHLLLGSRTDDALFVRRKV